MRTKRKYAHEIYPHPEEYEVLPLHKAVPYLYAKAIGLEVHGTSWFDWPKQIEEGPEQDLRWRATGDRTMAMLAARKEAMLADALLQGMKGQEAWEWADNTHEGWEIGYERAEAHGVPIAQIKPYPCGPEPDHHDHYGPDRGDGWRAVTRVDGKESECPDCCDPDPVVAVDLFGDATEEPPSAAPTN